MRNVIILGCGRSGTSLAAGCLAQAGYYTGDHDYIPKGESNPKGFFEDRKVNEINEAILSRIVPHRPPLLGRWFFRHWPVERQRWLAQVPLGTPISSAPSHRKRIEALTKKEPFCFKDPRFSYTLPAWRPFLKNTVFVCIFRDPRVTANSILREHACYEKLHSLSMNFQSALKIWTLMYAHIVKMHCREGDWIFLHYQQLLEEKGLDRLQAVTGARVDRSFPNPTLARSRPVGEITESTKRLYQTLCERAGYREKTFADSCID